MKNRFLVIVLIVSLLIGTALGYVITIYPQPELPSEFEELAIDEQHELGIIGADIVNNKLSHFESETLASSRLLQEILSNRSNIPNLPSYYHDVDVIEEFNMSDVPSNIAYSDKVDKDVSFEGSAYQIAPLAFEEDYQETYLEEDEPSVNPLTQISGDIRSEILASAKLDHLYPGLYRSSDENLWISFGSEKGYFRSFPWSSLSLDYDPRQQNWYSSAATGAKDIVVLIDKSASMENEKIENAINATKELVTGLGGRDRFNIIAFSDTTEAFSESLTFNTVEQQEQVDDFLEKLITGGITDYDLAFKAGLENLKQSGSNRRAPLLVFLTDGTPTIGLKNNETLIENIQEANGPVGSDLVLFGIGNDTSQELLEAIASATEGTYIQINDSSLIEPSISKYNNFLLSKRRASLTWSLPRIDHRTDQLVITNSLPVLLDNRLRGVVSVDISIEAVINLTRSINTDSSGYSFVFDLAGQNILHPTVNLTQSDLDQIRQPITELELDTEEFQMMIQQIQLDIPVTRILDYPDQRRVVNLTPIGNTSMILGLSTPLSDFIPEEVNQKLELLEIHQLAFLPGVGLGLLGALVILIFRNRLFKVQNNVEEKNQ